MSKLLTIAIDFDGVIHDYKKTEEGHCMGPPIPGALEALKALWKAEHTVIIFTCRGDATEHVRAWFKHYDCRYWDQITDLKPRADIYIDDKGLKFITWEGTLQAIADLG